MLRRPLACYAAVSRIAFMLLNASTLRGRFQELLASATAIDVAVAWMSSESIADELARFAGSPSHSARVLIGVYDYVTSPVALRRLSKASGTLKVAVPPNGQKFHPKVYLFTTGKGRICWIGSANMTDKGFDSNVELVHEFIDDDAIVLGWFEAQWKSHQHPDESWIAEYEGRYRQERGRPEPRTQMPVPASQDPFNSWSSYAAALTRLNLKWNAESKGRYGVFSGSHTYIKVIEAAEPIFGKDWANLSKQDAQVLLGLTHNYALFGSMKRARGAVDVFLNASPKNLKARAEIKRALDYVRGCRLDAVAANARRSHEIIKNQTGFNSGVATRLLSLARPEALVSVNSQSIDGLAKISAVPAGSLGKPEGYERIVQWLTSAKWWNASEPTADDERLLWLYRGALMDAFAYSGPDLRSEINTIQT